MQSISILDCTLRDGGYINNWKFGKKTIKSIINKLMQSRIDIIECGFLTEKVISEEYTLYDEVRKIRDVMPSQRESMVVAMIAIGEKEIHPSVLKQNNGDSIDGIRLTFHQNEISKAIEWAKIIKNKGYKVFMQPVGTISYTDLELLNLVEKMNELRPYAFYIVDTLGSMYRNELFHIFYQVDRNLNPDIHIGFHPHNNLQLAFSNAQELSRIQTKRKLIIDASVYGMGRGAGNLPTELITEYINRNISMKYDVMKILEIYDEHISSIREKYVWGYEVAYHIAATNVCHPNYASYLVNKQTLTMKDIEEIMQSIPNYERAVFNKKLIEGLYIAYQDNKIDDSNALQDIQALLVDKKILLLAPGNSLNTEKNKIQEYIKETTPYIISVNFMDERFPIDMCFVSNHKRIENIEENLQYNREICVVATSNVKLTKDDTIYVDYYSYINQDTVVFDNVGLMCLKLLKQCNVNEVILAGFDGFKTGYNDHYYVDNLILPVTREVLEEKQIHIKHQIDEISKDMNIKFLTCSSYEGEYEV